MSLPDWTALQHDKGFMTAALYDGRRVSEGTLSLELEWPQASLEEVATDEKFPGPDWKHRLVTKNG